MKIAPQKYSYMSQEFVPNGTLSFCIKNYLSGCQTKWSDGDTKLEQKITSFLNGVYFAAAYLKKQSLEREVERKRCEDEQKEYQRKLLVLEDEKRRLQSLDQETQAWHKSRMLRSYIRAKLKTKGSYAPDSEFARWVAWASAYADRLDPLKAANAGCFQ